MNYKLLKWIRVIIALVFLIFTTLIFIDFRDFLTENQVNQIVFLQFVPSLIKFITVFSLSALGFLVIILLTVFFGRVYCSAICPLGIIQDVFSRVGKLFRKKKRYKYLKARNILRNTILVIVILSALIFSVLLLNLLDPYSLYGKIANGLFRPVGVLINNSVAGILENMNVFVLYQKDQFPVHFATIIFPIIAFMVILYLSAKYGRLYCNTICPVGTLLGWISKISVFKININHDNCIKCGKCAFECKSGCINVKDMSVDYSRCVACFNCLTVCNDSAIDLSFEKIKRINQSNIVKNDKGRKAFILSSLAGIFTLAGIKQNKVFASSEEGPLNKKPTTVPVEKTCPVCPPGSLSIDHFNSTCTACQLCVSQCPTGVLQPSFTQYGIGGYMQPFMDYSSNYCNFECTLCSDICPTGAILELNKEEEQKKTLQIGKVNFIKENCVVYTENTACGSCSEHCPTQAVKMVPYKGSLTIPETDNSICVGCGACEHACPVVPYKAIYVDGNPIHQIAKEPKSEKMDKVEMEEFPF
jgi:ferredoxin